MWYVSVVGCESRSLVGWWVAEWKSIDGFERGWCFSADGSFSEFGWLLFKPGNILHSLRLFISRVGNLLSIQLMKYHDVKANTYIAALWIKVQEGKSSFAIDLSVYHHRCPIAGLMALSHRSFSTIVPPSTDTSSIFQHILGSQCTYDFQTRIHLNTSSTTFISSSIHPMSPTCT